jgi:hypothetical protein
LLDPLVEVRMFLSAFNFFAEGSIFPTPSVCHSANAGMAAKVQTDKGMFAIMSSSSRSTRPYT